MNIKKSADKEAQFSHAHFAVFCWLQEPFGGDSNVPSIFADVSLAQFRESTNFHVISQSGTQSYEFHASASWLTNEGEALFAMATNVGSVVLIKLAPMGIQGTVLSINFSFTAIFAIINFSKGLIFANLVYSRK